MPLGDSLSGNWAADLHVPNVCRSCLQVFSFFMYYVYFAIAPMHTMMLHGLVVMLVLNAVNMFFQTIRMVMAMLKIIRAAGRRGKMSLLTKRHVFIIPNYKEPLHVLRNTLMHLAK